MPIEKQVDDLIERLTKHAGSSFRQSNAGPGQTIREASPRAYRLRGFCPGEGFELIGNSYNLDLALVGTEAEAKRRGCLAVLIERKGNRCSCVLLADALVFEGFRGVLSSREYEWLASLPESAVIGPALDRFGRQIRTAFAVWRPGGNQEQRPERQLEPAKQNEA